jgi:hypothetical protein
VSGLIYGLGDDRGRVHGINLNIECKKTEAPWVCFVGHNWGNGPWTATNDLDLDRPCPRCKVLVGGFWELFEGAPRAYAVSEKRSQGAQDHASAAVQQAASAHRGANDLAHGEDDSHGEGGGISYVGAAVVVTTSPLLLCALDEAGAVVLSRTLRVATIAKDLRRTDDADGVAVLIVTLDGLVALLDDCDALVSRAADAAEPDEPESDESASGARA